MIARYGKGQYALVKGEKRYLGKVIRVGDKTVFYKSYAKKTSFFRKNPSLSFDIRLFPNLDKYRVDEVHFEFKEEHELHVVSYSEARARGTIQNNGEGSQLYVPINMFAVVAPFYKEPFGKSDDWIPTPQDHRPKPPKRAPRYKPPAGQALLFDGKAAAAGKDD